MTATSADVANGILLVDKPAGVTSHDVVARVRRAARSKRVGHAGTLDPFATGLLVVAIGSATRLLPYVNGEPKTYEAVIAFGNETDSDDSTGAITRVVDHPVDASMLNAAIANLTGTFPQLPPSFSAKHINGQRAYAIARKGGEVDLTPVLVTVRSWQVQWLTESRLQATIICAGGTYIRALARDLGRAMNNAAHCESLRRVSSGNCNVGDAVNFDDPVPRCIADGVIAPCAPLNLLQPMAVEMLDEIAVQRLRRGQVVNATQSGSRAVLVDSEQRVAAIAERTSSNTWQPRVVLIESSGA